MTNSFVKTVEVVVISFVINYLCCLIHTVVCFYLVISSHLTVFNGSGHFSSLHCYVLSADCEEMKALAVSNAEAAFKSHQHRVNTILQVTRNCDVFVFTRESSYCFQHVLAIAILSVCLSVCHTSGSVKNGAS